MKRGEGWKVEKINEAFIVRPPKKEAREKLNDNDFVSFLPMEDLNVMAKEIVATKEKKLKDVSGTYTYFAENDVLLAKITPCFENGKIGIARNLKNGIGFGSSEYIVFRSKGKVIPEYLFYYLARDEFRREGEKAMTGAAGQKRIPPSFVEGQEIAYPSIPEQKRIVALLDETVSALNIVHANAELNQVNARDVFNAVLEQEFQRVKANHKRKKITELCEIGDGNHGGNYPKKSDMRKSGVPFIRSVNLVNGHISTADMRFISKEKHLSLKKGHLKTGDVLFTNRGEMGKSAVVDSEYDDANLNSQIAFFRCSEQILPWYLYYILQSPYMQDHSTKSQTGAALQQLPIGIISKFEIPLPPLDEQHLIVDCLNSIAEETRRLEKIYQSKVDDIEELRESILQKAFEGSL